MLSSDTTPPNERVEVISVTHENAEQVFSEAKIALFELRASIGKTLGLAHHIRKFWSEQVHGVCLPQLIVYLCDLKTSVERAARTVFLPGRTGSYPQYHWGPLSPKDLLQAVGQPPPSYLKGATNTSEALVRLGDYILGVVGQPPEQVGAEQTPERAADVQISEHELLWPTAVVSRLTRPSTWDNPEWGKIPDLADVNDRNQFDMALDREVNQAGRRLLTLLGPPKKEKSPADKRRGKRPLEKTNAAKFAVYKRIHALYDPQEGSHSGRRERFLNLLLTATEHHDLQDAITKASLQLDLALINLALKCVGGRTGRAATRKRARI
jgi:hypothetical protein